MEHKQLSSVVRWHTPKINPNESFLAPCARCEIGQYGRSAWDQRLTVDSCHVIGTPGQERRLVLEQTIVLFVMELVSAVTALPWCTNSFCLPDLKLGLELRKEKRRSGLDYGMSHKTSIQRTCCCEIANLPWRTSISRL